MAAFHKNREMPPYEKEEEKKITRKSAITAEICTKKSIFHEMKKEKKPTYNEILRGFPGTFH